MAFQKYGTDSKHVHAIDSALFNVTFLTATLSNAQMRRNQYK